MEELLMKTVTIIGFVYTLVEVCAETDFERRSKALEIGWNALSPKKQYNEMENILAG